MYISNYVTDHNYSDYLNIAYTAVCTCSNNLVAKSAWGSRLKPPQPPLLLRAWTYSHSSTEQLTALKELITRLWVGSMDALPPYDYIVQYVYMYIYITSTVLAFSASYMYNIYITSTVLASYILVLPPYDYTVQCVYM